MATTSAIHACSAHPSVQRRLSARYSMKITERWGSLMRPITFALSLAVATVGLSQIALAADLPAKAPPKLIAPAFSWSGFYIGGHVGYLWGRTTFVDNGVVTETNAPTDGVIGGVLGGYNWQNGPIVLGVEGDFGWTNAHGNGAAAPPPLSTPTEIHHYDIHWTSHARGRVGYASGPFLVFVAGGGAFAKFSMTMQEIGLPLVPPVVCQGGAYTGWSVGGGVDYAFNNQISARAEYLYDDFGRKNYVMAANDVYQVHLTGSTVRGAIIFKLWPH